MSLEMLVSYNSSLYIIQKIFYLICLFLNIQAKLILYFRTGNFFVKTDSNVNSVLPC